MMKCLTYCVLAFILLIAIGCSNNSQPSNVVEQIKTTALLKDSHLAVSIVQKDTSNSSVSFLAKNDPLSKNALLISKRPIYSPKDRLYEGIKAETVTINKVSLATPSSNPFVKKSQFLSFNAERETVLQGTEGTSLTIPADCFETETGKILRGPAQLELKEFFKTSDMVLAHLTTQADGKLLETGGMLYLNATDAEGQPLKIRKDKNIKIELPASAKTADKQLFYGNQQTNGQINWTVANPVVKTQNANSFTIVEQQPEFPNGQAALFRFIQNEMKYPKIASENKIEGTVYVAITVLPEGSLGGIQIRRGIGGGCNEEAIRIIKKMPKWRPAKNREGNPVAIAYTLPIKFSLKNAVETPYLLKTDSLGEPQDTAYANKYFEILDEQEAVMRSNRLGWINCDRFLNLKNTTEFTVQTNKTDVDVHLVLKNYRSIIRVWVGSNNKARFSNVPMDEPVFIVATSPEGKQFNISVTEAVITKEKTTNIELKTVEKDQFLKELQKLNTIQ